jgi:hypothetical protein
MERVVADEARLGASGRKARATYALLAERRAIVVITAERAYRQGDRLTSRGVSYRLEEFGLPKTEKAFDHIELEVLVCRDSGLLLWQAIADVSRRVLRHGRFADREHALAWLAENYERDLWAEADVQAQVWIGKGGIASQIAGHAHSLGLDVFPMRGFSGAGFIRDAIAEAAQDTRPLVAFVADDADSSGLRSLEALERRVRRDAVQLGVSVEAVEQFAVTETQALGLPRRPQKDSTHRRATDPEWAVELDAMEPSDLRAALTEVVDRWCSPELREAALRAEEVDRAALASRGGQGGTRERAEHIEQIGVGEENRRRIRAATMRAWRDGPRSLPRSAATT